LHQEERPMTVFILLVAKNGPKFGPQFHQVEEPSLASDAAKQNLGLYLGGTMSDFVVSLRRNMQIIHPEGTAWGAPVPPVIDQTGLEGFYAIFLKLSGPFDDLPAAVEAQFGLKMDLRKQSTQMIVVDGAQRPRPN